MNALRIIIIIAWRNLWRNPRRTVLTAGTVSLGLGLLLVFLGIGDGSHRQMIQGAVRLGGAHVAVQAVGYQERGGIERTLSAEQIARVSSWAQSNRKQLGITQVLSRVFASGLVSSADGATGVRVIGLEPAKEKGVSSFHEKLIRGDFLISTRDNTAVIGEGVARKLKLEPGEKFVLMVQAAHSPEIQSLLLRVAGVMRTGLEDFDQATILIPLPTAQQLLKLGDEVHQTAIVLDQLEHSQEAAEDGKRRLGPEVEVLSWLDLMPELRDFIKIDDGGSYVFNSLFFMIIAFLVANTLLMSVLERRREFALLDALGFTPVRRFLLVILEAVWIALLSVAAGTGLGYAGHLYFYHRGLPLSLFYSSEVSAGGALIDPVIYSHLTWTRIFGAAQLVFALTFLLALLPAWRGAKGQDAHLLGQA
ncbi:MAG: ABC transporter permease [Acidobacteria bacterium]|nr:MAG: ABC transporter permease [Acidobacteriota bacterium]